MKRAALLGVLATLIFLVACSTHPPSAQGEEKKSQGDKFSIQAETATAKPGKKGTVTVVIKPGKGYKWNKNYPSSFKIVDSESQVATFASQKFSKAAFKNKDEKKSTTLALPFEAKAKGKVKTVGMASFSVCNEETCLIFRDEKVTLNVSVVP